MNTELHDHDLASTYGLRVLATVVFDIDSGQKLDALHPPACGLSEAAKTSLAHLSLPHCNNQDEGDTQFIVRFGDDPDDQDLLFGFVLFRQQKDESRTRGYFQKALVLVSTKPYVDLYDRVLRVVGPLFFKAGPQVLVAVYNNIKSWPDLVHDTPVVLPLAGTYISCIIPKLLDYEHLDSAYESDAESPVHSHFIVEGDDDATDVPDFSALDEEDDGEEEDTEETVLVKEGNFVVSRRQHPPSPSFADLLLSKRTHQLTPFENIGLYSSFLGLEETLWLLWQLAITGESFLILSPHARTCSQAVLAFTSLIAPLQFHGDCRPYFTVYEADFDTLSSRQNNGVSNLKDVTIIGTTNPFFMKSLSHWPNALIFPFLEPPSAKAQLAKAEETGTICLRIQKNVELDDFENSHRPMLLRRCPRYMTPDATVLQQLVSPPEVRILQTTSHEEEPYVTINNAVLRKHFRKLTKDFLHPFEQYFGIWKASGRRSNLYMSAEDYMKPFSLPGLLSSIKPRKLPPQIKQGKWKALYTAFVKGPHFEPWFNYRRQRCIHDFANTLRALRDGVDADRLLSSPFGANLSQEQYVKLKKEVEVALTLEKARCDVDKRQVRTIKKHLKAVKEKLRSFKQTQ
ncbi:uncharacterized protein PITG_05355 [Phytophthora infestans T30-4]|uniref:UDENN domain-containing protein n=1 Tax=Phytophthora infestans (strain T30-4) TaxID=403677 RepID=D0N452_PHYIT|nr:uncharacterized protein PITG_05355 [Phytophthora infestans T30-4]EEY69156.1 conserved hypothetical protein [Phytophthora infestans T30-4]|eukprot:XP_002999010.1 conserved hypothetical protein [Phytophthora infestans T30-4]